MKTQLATAALAAAIAATPAAAAVIDVSALSPTGTTVALAAGDYTIDFTTGAYSAWNPWNNVAGCDGNGMNCANGWAISLAIDLGGGNGFQYGFRSVPGNNNLYSTAAAALAAAQTGTNLIVAPLSQVANAAAYVDAPYPITLSLAAAQDVRFFIYDYPYGDNGGGVSFALERVGAIGGGVPEPATWAMLIAGFAAIGGALRRRARTGQIATA